MSAIHDFERELADLTSATLEQMTRHMRKAGALIVEAKERISADDQRIEELAANARAVLYEIDRARGLKIGSAGILDPLHPICIQAEHLRAVLGDQLPIPTPSQAAQRCRAVVARDRKERAP